MGHHPIGAQPVPTGEVASGISPAGWFFILIGIIILAIILYFVFKNKK